MKGTLTKTCRGGLLSSFIVISYIVMTASITLDLTELRNRVSKLKVNPKGNLWATGHFMGKKSVVDGSFPEPAFKSVKSPSEDRAVQPLQGAEDLQAQFLQMLKTVQESKERALNTGDPA